MTRTFTVPMDFVLDAANILCNEFYTYGIQGNVLFQINELDPNTQQYNQINQGAIDFNSVKDSGQLNGYKFTCNVMQNDITALIAAYESTVFEIPLNVPQAVLIQMPGITLSETAVLNFSASPDFKSNAFFELTVVTNQINFIYPSVQNSGFVAQDVVNFSNTGKWFYRATIAGKIRLWGNVGVSVYRMAVINFQN